MSDDLKDLEATSDRVTANLKAIEKLLEDSGDLDDLDATTCRIVENLKFIERHQE